jgi:hypothetical protein
MTDDQMHALQDHGHREALALEMAGLRQHAERARWCEERKADVFYSYSQKQWYVSWTSDSGFRQVPDADRDTAIDRAMTEDK